MTQADNIKGYKKINKKLEQNLNTRNDRLDKVMNEFESLMKTTKTIPFDKKHIVIEKETFDTMSRVVKKFKKVMKLEPKIKDVFKEVNNYVINYNVLGKDNQKYQSEIKEYFDSQDFDLNDVYDISKETTKEDKLFDYAGVPNYLKTTKNSEKEKDNLEISI